MVFNTTYRNNEDEDLIVDTHGADVIDPVWDILDKAYEHFGVFPTLLERDFNIPPLAELLGDEDLAEELQNNPDATVQDFADAGLDVEDETSMFVAGYITITTLDGDLTAGLRQRELTQVKLRGLE